MVEVVEEDTFAARALSLRRRQRARPLLRSPTGVAGARILPQRKPPPQPPPSGTTSTKKEEEEAKKNRAEEKR